MSLVYHFFGTRCSVRIAGWAAGIASRIGTLRIYTFRSLSKTLSLHDPRLVN